METYRKPSGCGLDLVWNSTKKVPMTEQIDPETDRKRTIQALIVVFLIPNVLGAIAFLVHWWLVKDL